MPSITYWSRLEPRPRAPSIADTLAARVRDPLWFLARQWQLGELQGEDAAAPAYVELGASLGALREWSPHDGAPRPLPPDAPLEPLTLAEDADTSDLSLAVELGQRFEQTIVALGRPPTLRAAFRGAYPLGTAADAVDPRDGDGLRLLDLAVGRVTDGVALLLAAGLTPGGLPALPPLDPEDVDDVRAALDDLRAWVRDTVGTIGRADAEAWVPERLEYDLVVTGREPVSDLVNDVRLVAHPDRDGRCEWHAFDAAAGGDAGDSGSEGIRRLKHSVIPTGASFRGMPSARWWAFESGATNLAAMRPEKRELAKLVVLDFLLVHGNDWYVLPFQQPLGTLCHVESLVVHDVFGGLTLVERADQSPAPPGRRWTMFSTAVAGTPEVAGFFFLSPTVGGAAQAGVPVEEVRFLRDEMANMAWGIERVVQGRTGEPWPGNERAAASEGTSRPAPAASDAVLRYRVQTDVPRHWTPFLPVVIDATRRDVALERGVLLRSASEGETGSEPAGRILRPSRLADAPYRLGEEELPRIGLRVVRATYRARWTDGRTFVWQARRTTPGTGEERSGLQFDVAVVG